MFTEFLKTLYIAVAYLNEGKVGEMTVNHQVETDEGIISIIVTARRDPAEVEVDD